MTYTLIPDLSEEWLKAIGEAEDTFTAIVWGNSGNGKTSFVMQLLKMLSPLGYILYVGYEEGHGASFKKAVERSGLQGASMGVLDGADYDEIVRRIKRKRGPKIVVFDSWQYSGLSYEQYKALKEAFVFGKKPNRRKILIFISHADGRQPNGTSAKRLMYDANIKVHVEGFIARIVSRFGSLGRYSIYEDKARAYWGRDYDAIMAGLPKGAKPPRKPKAPKKAKKQATEQELEQSEKE